jgi:glycosyltransferase involved in cell wall biosynthesis
MTVLSSVPLVGLGMPVYNGARYVAEAIRSVLRQTMADFDLVICDNCSTDETQEICLTFAGADERVRYFRNDSNLGAHPNFNRTFELARGKYFKWASHDDVLQPGFLRACVDALEQNAAAALCQSDIDYIDESGRIIGTRQSHLSGAESGDPAIRFAALVLQPHDCQAMMGLFRRDILGRSMLLPSFHGADRAMLAQVALLGRFIHVAGAYLQIRDHGSRYSQARKRPEDRAAWHDTSNRNRPGFPVLRTYQTYWKAVAAAPISARDKTRARMSLIEWWFRNYNSARVAVDLIGSVFPGFVGAAERFKQSVFSPAPGSGEAPPRKKR